ncbi:MAG: disulfide bond formation protein DsbA [Firmicutes bacterium]|nr:disulfide bond formation protein DsbA [Bacillota bacterium]MBO2521971.1 disulfide bond formation protein DsbA [Bacillota bacterium]
MSQNARPPIPVEVYSDYVCPWCYMNFTSLEQVSREFPLEIQWRAFELQPREAPLDPGALAEKQRYIEAHFPAVRRIAKDQYGLDLSFGRLDVDTRLAHVGAKLAAACGKAWEYHAKVFEAHWVQQADIGDPEVLAGIAGQLGIDREAFREGLDDEELHAGVLREEAAAHRLGIRGVPATVIAGRYLLSGAQTRERLRSVFQEYQRRGQLGS